MERFSRTELLLGQNKLATLKKSCVCIIGLGAVGSYALEGLVRAGVGRLIVADFDAVRLSNINRQLLATEKTLGMKKVAAAQERVHSINPDAQILLVEDFMDDQSIIQILQLKPNVVIDAIDSLNPKIQVLAALYKAGIPVVSSMGAATRTDPAMVRTADLFDTKICPLAARLRRRLKEEGVGRGIQCVYSEQSQNVQALSSESESEKGDYSRGRIRRRLGSLSTITGIFGLIAATIALKSILGDLNKGA